MPRMVPRHTYSGQDGDIPPTTERGRPQNGPQSQLQNGWSSVNQRTDHLMYFCAAERGADHGDDDAKRVPDAGKYLVCPIR